MSAGCWSITAATGASGVRLKSAIAGDLRRLEEELERAPTRLGLAYEIIPGVTAACAAAAVSAIPLTPPAHRPRLQFVNAAPRRDGRAADDLNWSRRRPPRLDRPLHGKTDLSALAARLIAQGCRRIRRAVGRIGRACRSAAGPYDDRRTCRAVCSGKCDATAVILYGALAGTD